jgi:hypothetical protein
VHAKTSLHAVLDAERSWKPPKAVSATDIPVPETVGKACEAQTAPSASKNAVVENSRGHFDPFTLESDLKNDVLRLCSSCGDWLELHQPDCDLPQRLLATCGNCKAWFLVNDDDEWVEITTRSPDGKRRLTRSILCRPVESPPP